MTIQRRSLSTGKYGRTRDADAEQESDSVRTYSIFCTTDLFHGSQ